MTSGASRPGPTGKSQTDAKKSKRRKAAAKPAIPKPAGRLVAVTGASGFLGAHIVAALAKEGARTRVLLHRQPPHPLWQHLPVETVAGSVMDPEACARLVAGADAVIHAAGLIKTIREAEFSEINMKGAAILAEAAREAKADRFVLVSSLAAREPLLSPYAASKRAGELMTQAAFIGLPQALVILRPPAIYGPWDPETLAFFKGVSGRIAPVFGTGKSVVIHVEDAANAIVQVAMGAGDAGCFALTGPDRAAYTLRELLQAAASACGRNPVLVQVPAGILRAAGAFSGWRARRRKTARIFTSGKASELLHPDWTISADEALPRNVFRPAVKLPEGFRKTVDWYKTAGWLG